MKHEHRRLTKKEKWAIGGAAGLIGAVALFALYERKAKAAPNVIGPIPGPTPTTPSGGGGGGGTGDQNVSTTDHAANGQNSYSDVPSQGGDETGS